VLFHEVGYVVLNLVVEVVRVVCELYFHGFFGGLPRGGLPRGGPFVPGGGSTTFFSGVVAGCLGGVALLFC